MAETTATAIIEQQRWLEPVGDEVQMAVTSAFAQAGETGQKVKDFLHGTWLGHPLHLGADGYPGGVVDCGGDHGCDGGHHWPQGVRTPRLRLDWLAPLGLRSPDLTDWQATDGRARQIGLVHGVMNSVGALLFIGSLIARNRNARQAGRGLSVFGYAVALGAAYLGGKLVYSEQIGTDHTTGQRFSEDFKGVLSDSELSEGEMRRVDVDGSRALLAKRDGHVYGSAEVCSHLGGPLAEGKFEECTVQCPWHGSRFSVESGAVIDGPATHPQPCLDVRVRDGLIEVRKKAGEYSQHSTPDWLPT